MTRNNYKWDGDSRDERHSEFVHSGYATTTAGAFHSTWAQQQIRRRRGHRLAVALRPMLVAAVMSGLLLCGLVSYLHS